MKKSIFIALALMIACTACSTPASLPTTESSPSLAPEDTEPPPTEIEESWPPVVGQDPSPLVAAFYYPWYFNQEFDGQWDHWGTGPPGDIDSDYYPVLGAYSESNPSVLAQHFAWMRQAGIGVIISSWWGRYDPTDRVVPLMLDMADHYGIKVAFHIEPYTGRSATRLIQDINYLYAQYGDHPAFYWTNESSCYSTEAQPKGLFFLWASVVPDGDSSSIEPDYWQEAMDTLHAQNPGAIVITDQSNGTWVTGGHFDGAYNYGVLDVDEVGYDWAVSLPSCAWYIPGINPGFSAIKINYEDWVNTPRRDGATYDDRWERMFEAGVEPAMVAITTFNEWHEGTQIEPSASGVTRPSGEPYLDFSPLDPEGYLEMTQDWAQVFLNFEWPQGTLVRLRARTTSDWTDIHLISGASWRGPNLISVSEFATRAEVVDGFFTLNQPLHLAEAGNQIEAVFDLEFIAGDTQAPLVFEIERGGLGATWVELYRFDGQDWVQVDTFWWAGHSSWPRNAATFEVDYETIFGAAP